MSVLAWRSRPEDGVCRLRREDVRRIIAEELDVTYSLQAVYNKLHRLGYSCLAPRPRHEKQDSAAPPFVKTLRQALAPHGGKVRVFFMDEARFGQQGTRTRVWRRTGSRPTAVKQTRYEWVYLYASVEPARHQSKALGVPKNITILLLPYSPELYPIERRRA